MYILDLLNKQWKDREVKVTYEQSIWTGKCVGFEHKNIGNCLILSRDGQETFLPIDFDNIEHYYPVMTRVNFLKALAKLKKSFQWQIPIYNDLRKDGSLRCKVVVLRSLSQEIEQLITSQGFEFEIGERYNYYAKVYLTKEE